jgi:hypothetical protein
VSDDIIDRIDELVDEQLANYHNRSGYDHNINQDKCWHCGGEWHGLAITQKIMAMKSTRTYDEGYKYADDDSPVICPGSEFIGPLPESVARVPLNVNPFDSVDLQSWFGSLLAGSHPVMPNATVTPGGQRPAWVDELIEATTVFCLDILGWPTAWLPGDPTPDPGTAAVRGPRGYAAADLVVLDGLRIGYTSGGDQ